LKMTIAATATTPPSSTNQSNVFKALGLLQRL